VKSSLAGRGRACSKTANRNFFMFGFSDHWIGLELPESGIIVFPRAFLFRRMKMRKVCN
jgi:hypothetical protein